MNEQEKELLEFIGKTSAATRWLGICIMAFEDAGYDVTSLQLAAGTLTEQKREKLIRGMNLAKNTNEENFAYAQRKSDEASDMILKRFLDDDNNSEDKSLLY